MRRGEKIRDAASPHLWGQERRDISRPNARFLVGMQFAAIGAHQGGASMRLHQLCAAAVLTLPMGCASRYPAPTEHLATSMAAARGAEEAGAPQVPQAALQLELAQEQINQAQRLVQEGENEKAD